MTRRGNGSDRAASRIGAATAILLGGFTLAGFASAEVQQAEEVATFGRGDAPIELLVRGAIDIPVFAPVLDAFVDAFPDIRVTLEAWNTNRIYEMALADCIDGRTPADLLFSSAADQIVKLANDGCAQPHRSLVTGALPPAANWRDEVFGITQEPAVIIYNRILIGDAEAPRSRFELIDLLRPTDSRFIGRVATYDIERSGVGYLFAFADSQQATTYGSLIEAFARSGAVATCCSEEIIDGVANGLYLVGYNVLGSYALDRAASDPRIAVVAPTDYTLVLRRAAMIPRDADEPAAAGLLIDFMLSDAGRAALAAKRLLFPFGPDAVNGLPEDDASLYRPIPLSPTLLLGLDQQKRASFLERWRQTFRRP